MPRACCFAPLLLVFAGLPLFAQSEGQAHVPRAPYPAEWKPTPQQMFVSYWTLEPGWSTQLEIRNNVTQRDLTVTPVLRTPAGAEIALQPVTIPPEHVTIVDLREAVLSIAPELLDRADSFGSVVYRYNANSESNLFAASMVQRSASPIGFHFDGEPLDKGYDSGTVESIWWMPSSTASEYLILGNASTRPVVASLSVSDAVGRSSQRSVELGPAQTQRIDLRAITKAARFGGLQGGITVSVRSGAGNLLASHIVFDESTGMSAMMKTFERNPAEKPGLHTLRGPMMALTTPDPALMFPEHANLIPQIFLRNAGSSPLDAAVTLDWRSPVQRGSLPLPAINLGSGAVRVLDLTDFTRGARLPADAYWGTVVVKYQGLSGDLIPVATSFDATGRYGLQTAFSEDLSRLWKGSMWHVDARRNSLITTGNGGSAPTHAALTLFYNNGKSSYTIEQQLEPGEQIWANVGELIRNQIPDKDGKTIPPDVTMGSYELRDLDHRGVGYLYEGKLVLDKTWGHGYYGCAQCLRLSNSKARSESFFGNDRHGRR